MALSSLGLTAAVAELSIGGGTPVVAVGASTPSVVAHHPRDGSVVNLASAPTAPPPEGTPTALSIPAIGVDTSIVGLGLNADGSAQVPSDTTQVGWFSGGPAPGQPGPAVILGHVDSYQGPGVFFDLHDLQSGAQIDVTVGSTVKVFAVEQVDTYSKDQFPTEAVFGPVPDRALRLVTCGGPFDRTVGHYQDNVVVYAVEISSGTSSAST